MKKIPLTQGKFTLVDDEDFEWLSQWKWCAHKDNNTFYAHTRTSRSLGPQRTIKMHRLILGLIHNDNKQTDHFDRNGLNNRRNNLRICTASQNAHNRQRRIDSASKYKGVAWHKRNKKWQATIGVNSKVVYLGQFVSETEAAQKYNEAAVKHHREFARLNEIQTTL